MPGDIGKNYGLSIQEITPELARYMSLKSAEGVMVSAVRPGSQADKDGIRVGDILIEINGQNLQDVNAVQTLVAESDGDLKAQLIRDQQTLVITLRLRELPP
jgi:S1-C subfamily serine protease